MVDKELGPQRCNAEGPEIDPSCDKSESLEAKQKSTDSSIPMHGHGEFPIEEFPEPIRSISQELAYVYDVPISLPALSCIAFLSGAIGKLYVVKGGYKDKQTHLNLYVILAVERGLGKGNIGDTLSRPILIAEQEMHEIWKKGCAEAITDIELNSAKFKAAKSRALKDDLEARNDMQSLQEQIDEAEACLKRQPALMIDDTTSEALAMKLEANHEFLFSYSSEAGNLLQVALGKYTESGGDYGLLLNAYSGDQYKSERVNRDPVILKNPRLAVLWMVQNSVLDELLGKKDAYHRGLTARPLIVDTGARRMLDDGSDRIFTKADLWNGILAPILNERLEWNDGSEPKEIICTGEAQKVFTDFNNESVMLERTRYQEFMGELSRWRENAIKLAGLFQFIKDKSRMIDEKTARAACEIVRWCGVGYMEGLLEKSREALEKERDRLISICLDEGGEVTLGKLKSNHNYRDKKSKRARYIVSLFPDRLRIEKRKGKSKPSEVLMLVKEQEVA